MRITTPAGDRRHISPGLLRRERLRRLCLSLAVVLFPVAVAAQIPEPNVNMVAGTTLPGGDPFLQRQNEPSIAVSTRNPLHVLGGANDYRTVDIPFDTPASPDQEERGDAWLGVFKSRNGGQTWWSDLLPGYPQQTGSTSPLFGYQAAADPVVRAGQNGMFYYSGIVLNRDAHPASGVFVARFIDNNSKEYGDPFSYLGTNVIDRGTSGAFTDKPWIAVGPGTPGGKCTVGGQTFDAQNVYLAYTTFLGNDNNVHTKLMFARSTDCGSTWSAPIKLSESNAINQGATIGVAPNGAVYVVWRRFKSTAETNAIMVAKSTDKGQTFAKGAVVTNINPFEQGMTGTAIRTNAYPSLAIDSSSRLWVAWSERAANGDGRIQIISSPDGVSWGAAQPVDAPALRADDGTAARGHQFMPALSIAADKLVVAYYDLRDDHRHSVYTPLGFGRYKEDRAWVSADTTGNVFLQYLMDSVPAVTPALAPLTRRHTLDVRAAMASVAIPVQTPSFSDPVRVSRYIFGSRTSTPGALIEQLQFNPPNLPMFRLGTAPFLGDYIDITGYAIKGATVFHAAWTDNRDVRPPRDGNWAHYTPPQSAALGTKSVFNGSDVPQCTPGYDFTGTRNQNIYGSRLTDGVFAASPSNAKQLGLIPRSFVVFVQNATNAPRSFDLTITNQPLPDGTASFDQHTPVTTLSAVPVPARSLITRTVYMASSNPRASVNVDVTEFGGGTLATSVVLNPDVSNPDVSNPDVSNPDVSNPDVSNPDVSNSIITAEVHNPDVSNVGVSSPDVSNPDVSNPDVSNPDVSNPDVSNPDVSNMGVGTPDVSNPDVSNPDVSNPDVSNSPVSDVTYTVTNKGNTASAYTVHVVSNANTDGVHAQLIVHRLYQTPVAQVDSNGNATCKLGLQTRSEVLINVPTVPLNAPDPNPPSLWLAPGDAARITLRISYTKPGVVFDPASSLAAQVTAQAANVKIVNGQAVIDPNGPITASPLFITTTAAHDAVAGQPYSMTFGATGGAPPYVWTVTSPSGFVINASGQVTQGTFASAGNASITVNVKDSTPGSTGITKTFAVRVVAPLAIVTTALPNATQGFAYSTTMQSTGGVAPIHWSVVTSVPDDMALSDAGTISGVCPYTETPVVKVRATDSSNPPQIVDSQSMPLVVESAVCTGNASAFFDNWNGGGVGDNGQSPTFSTNGSTYCVDHIEDYHWNSGNGAAPGTIGLFFTDRSRTLGPWTATATSGQNNAPNVNWSATPAPAVFVINGTYKIIDSSPTTWSQNAQSGGLGFSRVWLKAAVPPTHTATLHLQYNGQPLVLTKAPEQFGYNETANAYLNANQLVWNGNDTVTVSGLPNGTYNVEVATRELSNQEYLPGEFWNQVQFTVNNADTDVTFAEHKLLHITSPANNATTFAAFACPPSLSIPAPTLLSWDPINVSPATYQYFVYRGSCAAGVGWTLLDSGTTTGTSASLNLPSSAAGEFYAIKIYAYNANNQRIGEVMTIGTNWHGWALEFTVP